MVFGIFVFSLYFALLSFVSFLAVSSNSSPSSSYGQAGRVDVGRNFLAHQLQQSLKVGLRERKSFPFM